MPDKSDKKEKEDQSFSDSDNSDWYQSPTHAPLFYWPISYAPLEEKLARMREALEAGSDPNEVDHSTCPTHQVGRPLNICLDETMAYDSRRIFENAPLIKLLLEHGADPRLYGVPSNPHVPGYPRRPIDEAWGSLPSLRASNSQDPYYKPRELAFYEEVYAMMKEAADRLDRKEKPRSSCILM